MVFTLSQGNSFFFLKSHTQIFYCSLYPLCVFGGRNSSELKRQDGWMLGSFWLFDDERKNRNKLKKVVKGHFMYFFYICKIVFQSHGRVEIGNTANHDQLILWIDVFLYFYYFYSSSCLFQPTVAIKGKSISMNKVEQRFFSFLNICHCWCFILFSFFFPEITFW